MRRLEQGDVTLVPTDKNYKVYIRNLCGEPFSRTYKHRGNKDDSEADWVWKTDEVPETKFYFQHLSDEQKRRFVELFNEKKLLIGYPGYFYRLPFFMQYAT